MLVPKSIHVVEEGKVPYDTVNQFFRTRQRCTYERWKCPINSESTDVARGFHTCRKIILKPRTKADKNAKMHNTVGWELIVHRPHKPEIWKWELWHLLTNIAVCLLPVIEQFRPGNGATGNHIRIVVEEHILWHCKNVRQFMSQIPDFAIRIYAPNCWGSIAIAHWKIVAADFTQLYLDIRQKPWIFWVFKGSLLCTD